MATHEMESSRIVWTIDELLSADNNAVRIRFSATAWPPNNAADQKLFAEVFGHHSSPLDLQTLRGHFAPALHAAACQLSSTHEMAHWLSDSGQSELLRALQKAADAVAFNCGMSIAHPMEIEIDSPSLRRRQRDQAQRQMAEESAADRLQHAKHTIALLSQFESLYTAAPHLKPAQLLQQLAPLDQGETLQALLMAEASKKPATLWIASGPQLLKFTLPTTFSPVAGSAVKSRGRNVLSASADGLASSDMAIPAPQRILLSPDMPSAPLRSVCSATIAGRSMLLLGAQNGIIRVDPAIPGQSLFYHDEASPRQMGFNSSVILENVLWAAHGEAGLVAWAIDRPDAPLHSLRPDVLQQNAGASSNRPGHLTRLDDQRALFSLGASLLLVSGKGEIAPIPGTAPDRASAIIAVLDEQETLAILHADGQLLRVDRSTLAVVSRQTPAGPLTSAAALAWMESTRILLATREGAIHCIGRDDPLITQYLSPHRALPILAAATGWIAAVSSDRQKLILWHTWDNSKPAAELSITPLTRHRIADIAFADAI